MTLLPIAQCDENFENFPFFDLTLRYLELCNSVIGHLLYCTVKSAKNVSNSAGGQKDTKKQKGMKRMGLNGLVEFFLFISLVLSLYLDIAAGGFSAKLALTLFLSVFLSLSLSLFKKGIKLCTELNPRI